MNKADIQSGIVKNIIFVDPENIPDFCKDWPDATEDCKIGGSFVNGQFFPPEAKPETQEQLEARRQRMKLTFSQLMIGLVSEQFISEAEGEAWLQGILPQSINDMITMLPADQRFATKAKASRLIEALRSDPIVWALADSKGVMPEELDQFFIKYSAV